MRRVSVAAVAAAMVLLCALHGRMVSATTPVNCTTYSTQADCPATMPSIGTLKPCVDMSKFANTKTEQFVVLGDYGLSYANCEAQVAQLIAQMEKQFAGATGGMDFMFTTGDNNYWSGDCDTMFENIGQYYGQYFVPSSNCIDPITQLGARLSTQQRFWPTLGNHDWDSFAAEAGQLPYLQYFDYLQNSSVVKSQGFGGQWYNVQPSSGLVELFAVNSNIRTGGNLTMQQDWLKQALSESSAPWKLVTFHHPPYCTAQHDPLGVWMRWPYEQWGASVVFAGHQHVYERLGVDPTTGGPGNFPYIVNGLGGHSWLYEIHNCTADEHSKVRYNTAHGAMWGIATETSLDLCFYSIENGGTLVDHWSSANPAA